MYGPVSLVLGLFGGFLKAGEYFPHTDVGFSPPLHTGCGGMCQRGGVMADGCGGGGRESTGPDGCIGTCRYEDAVSRRKV